MALDILRASDGNGEAVRSIVTAIRMPGSTTLSVDSLTNWPAKFIATSGSLLEDGTLDPATVTVFEGHTNVSQIIIDSYAPGYSDIGNSEGQVVVVKPTTWWADQLTSVIGERSPTGVINQFAGSAAPTGWLLCDGALITRADYADLFAVIGETYGAGDGTTTFALPNLKGKVLFGLDTADTAFDTLGESGGEKSHTHPLGSDSFAMISNDSTGIRLKKVNTSSNWTPTTGSAANASTANLGTTSLGTGLGGNTDSTSTLPPYMVLNHIIKV